MGFSFNVESDSGRDFITVKVASEISGYNQQYIRRLLRGSIFRSKRLGQLWLIDRDSFLEYLHQAQISDDKRFGPQVKSC